MVDPKNFLNVRASIFSDSAIAAAGSGNLKAAGPLLDALNKALVVSRGVAEVLAMQQANETQIDSFGDKQPGEAIEPPVNRYTICALASLAQFACEALGADIESVSRWIDKHGIKGSK